MTCCQKETVIQTMGAILALDKHSRRSMMEEFRKSPDSRFGDKELLALSFIRKFMRNDAAFREMFYEEGE